MIHLKFFPNSTAVGSGVEVNKPNVSYLRGKNVVYVPGGSGTATVIYNSTTDKIEVETLPDYSQMYLTFEAIENGTFSFTNDITYSLDDGATWTSLFAYDELPITAGNTIMWKGFLRPQDDQGIGTFIATGNFNAYGNVMSLLYEDDFIGQTDLTDKDYAFLNLFGSFSNNAKIVNAQNLILPATTLASYCYRSMFVNCTSLTTAPELPATTLAYSCYDSMFNGCTSLTTAPALPATTLANSCYTSMFGGCTGLTTAPALPATTLADYCYYGMFQGCRSLTTAPALSATTLVSSCYSSMFQGCSNLTTAPALPATTLASSCYSYMFVNCTSLTTAPALPATTLASTCYRQMFQGCSGLTTAPELPATTLTNNCYYQMFYRCTNLNYIKMLATNISATNALNNWVNGVSATGTFVKNTAMTDLPTGTSGIPTGWTVQNATS